MFIYENRASVILFNILNNFRCMNQKFLIPLNGCSIIPFTFLKAGINFDFVDISNDSLCMDEELVLKILDNDKSNKYVGVLFIKSYGINMNSNDFFKKIKDINSNLFIIDDRCLCIPDLNFYLNSTYADLTLFSTGGSKYIEIGGGFAYLKDTFLYTRQELLFSLKDYNYLFQNLNNFISGKKSSFIYNDSNWLGDKILPFKTVLEYKKNINDKLVKTLKHKKNINSIYTNELPIDIQYKKEYQVWRFNISVNNKNKVLKNIFEAGLFASSHYIPLNRVLKNIIIYSNNKNKYNADLLYEKNINLFNNFDFSEEMAFKLSNIIKSSILK